MDADAVVKHRQDKADRGKGAIKKAAKKNRALRDELMVGWRNR